MNYHGQSIISEESFLRTLPHIVDLKQRLQFQALVLSSDIITYSFQELIEFAVELGADFTGGNINSISQAKAFNAAWSIIDQLYATRRMLHTMVGKESSPVFETFLKETMIAYEMRNEMDHLFGKMDNIAAKKHYRSPIFGSLSYFLSDNENDVVADSGYSVMIFPGGMHERQNMNMCNPVGRNPKPPADLFVLSAFEKNFEFAPALATLTKLYSKIEKILASQLEKHAATISLKENISIDKLMTHRGADYAFAIHMNLKGDAVHIDIKKASASRSIPNRKINSPT